MIYARTLKVRHGELTLGFGLVPPEPKQMYSVPVKEPAFYKQRLYIKTKRPFISPEEKEGEQQEQKNVHPFNGSVFLHPQGAWELFKNLNALLEGEIEGFFLSFQDDWSKNPMVLFYTPQDGEAGFLHIKAQGETNDHEPMISKLKLSMQEAYELSRYLKKHAQMELIFYQERLARFFRWGDEYFLYDVPPALGPLSQSNREKLLDLFYKFLKGEDRGVLGIQDRITFRINAEKDCLTIHVAGGLPMDLDREKVKELQLFLK